MIRRRSGSALLWGLLCALLCVVGCSGHKTVPRSAVDSKDWGFDRKNGQKIGGYTTVDGVLHKYDGRVRKISADTLQFIGAKRRDWAWGPDRIQELYPSFRTPTDSIYSVRAEYASVTRSFFFVVGTVLVVALVALTAIAIAWDDQSSCPYLYSWDGERFVLDGEPYGGAVMRSLERPDWSELEHLVARNGRYGVLLTNESDETQHTNSLELLVVDHPPGTLVLMDRQGRAHAFRTLEPLRSAHDESGRDLSVWLRERDESVWSPSLRSYANLDSVSDTRNHITLEFARPPGVTRAYLVSNASTSRWGAQMMRILLGMRGTQIQPFYAAINGSPALRERLRAWNEREELFELIPEIDAGGGTWERQDFIPAGGPVVSESRAVPIDLSRVRGETVRIRIHPPIGFWDLNSFHLAWDETGSTTTECRPIDGRAEPQAKVKALLRVDDDAFLDFPNVGDRAEIVFKAPRPAKGMDRTVFARTQGWYEIHFRNQGAPDFAGLKRLEEEPGYAVRRAIHDFAEFERAEALRQEVVPAGGE